MPSQSDDPADSQTSSTEHDPLDFNHPLPETMERLERELAERKPKPRELPARDDAPARTTPIAVRFDQFTIKRLRSLAERRNIGYQTLLKQFVIERLYEEERREGIIE